MRQSTYKGILDFLKKVQNVELKGQQLTRLQSIVGMVCSCIHSKRCTIVGLSQSNSVACGKKKESLLKQTRRTLSNKWIDWELFYLPFAVYFLAKAGQSGELIFVIDGSQIGGEHTSLMLSVLWRNNAIPVAWVVKKVKKGHFSEQIHLDLLEMLRLMVPENCRIVLLGDGEFDGLGLREFCDQRAWEYVVRTSSDRPVNCGVETVRFDKIRVPTGQTCVFIENAVLGSNAVAWHDRRYKEPLFLLTNMDVGIMACKYYKKRFKIETMFKQLKSHGFQLHKTQLVDAEKINRLILVAAWAFCFTFCLGLFLKTKVEVQTLELVVRKCKIPKMGYIYIAQQFLQLMEDIPLNFFAQFEKHFNQFLNQKTCTP